MKMPGSTVSTESSIKACSANHYLQQSTAKQNVRSKTRRRGHAQPPSPRVKCGAWACAVW